jgi:hypothetical protein
MVWCVAAIGLGLAAWTCRDIEPFEPRSSIRGYQLDGVVTTANGIPLDSVAIILYYDLALRSLHPLDSTDVVLSAPAQIDVNVFTTQGVFVKQLFSGVHPAGVVERPSWDGTDQNDSPMPSGEYVVRYVVGSTLVKSVPVIIDGRITTMTDAVGRFSIANDRFPIGKLFDVYNSQNMYTGTFVVESDVQITLRRSDLIARYLVSMRKDEITSVRLTL